MESIILTYWRGDQHRLLTTLLQHSDSALHSPQLFIRRMCLTDNMILQKNSLKNISACT